MAKKRTIFTSESVCAGHPDKIADQISDAIVDAALRQDKNARVAVETLVTVNQIILAGEVHVQGTVNYETIAREQIKRLGYTDDRFNFTHTSPLALYIHQQSSEIAQGVAHEGAGDQGMMFGFACTETPELMPIPIMLAHALCKQIDTVRENGVIPYLRPDGKSQVTVRYENGIPIGIDKVVLAVPHDEAVSLEQVTDALYTDVVTPVLKQYQFECERTNVIVNGTGVWHIGGPASDTGLTGRKIVVDGYGGYARVGGGAFSGKDATKVDRSGAYAARFIAKHIVAHKLAEKAEVRLAYVIGQKYPVWFQIDTFGTAKKSEQIIQDFAKSVIDISVKGIIEKLRLYEPIFLPTAAYGHFGKTDLPWEEI